MVSYLSYKGVLLWIVWKIKHFYEYVTSNNLTGIDIDRVVDGKIVEHSGAVNTFEAWLGGGNRMVQAEYIEQMRHIDIGNYKLSRINPGVDSIIEVQIIEHPNFDQAEDLMQKVESKTVEFTKIFFRFCTNDATSNHKIIKG